ncbi:hypothetical protein OP864_04105 [Saprospira grandis]|nr:hypothetical protein [Saprospira grandis]WBM75427.1 hypothetical protein OP864_04105 [Saprospira grandis]
MLRGSQVCSALRGLRPLGLACGHRCAALGRSSPLFRLKAVLRPLKFVAFPLPVLVLNPKLATGTRLPLLDVVKNSL